MSKSAINVSAEFNDQLLNLKRALGVTQDKHVASALGLSVAAFCERKRRDSWPMEKVELLLLRRPEVAARLTRPQSSAKPRLKLLIDGRHVVLSSTASTTTAVAGKFDDEAAAIGSRLRSERKRLQLTQSALAGFGLVTKNAQIHYECGARSPNALYLARVARVGVDIGFVIAGQREPNRASAVEFAVKHQGMSIAEWCRQHQLPQQTVRDLLSGKAKGHRGIAHRAAVLLGLKEGVIEQGAA